MGMHLPILIHAHTSDTMMNSVREALQDDITSVTSH
jgi:hypothetical protein